MKTSIVFQGPTNYCRQALENISSKHEIIYSTWSDEPEENLKFIEKRVSKLILNEHPKFVGFRNINRQTTSTKNGILNSSGDFIFKSRSDIYFSDLDLVVEKAHESYSKDISFFCYYVKICDPHQICDFFSYGTREESLNFWDYLEVPNQKFPSHGDPKCAERQLILNYIKKKDKNDINGFLKNSDFFAPYLPENSCDIKWIKFNYSFLKAWHEDVKAGRSPNFKNKN